MTIQIIAELPKDQIYCTGSFTKLLTTFVCLSFLGQEYKLEHCVDDVEFLDKIAINHEAKSFLALFQRMIGSQFSIRDLCSYYSGLPYTFDLAERELAGVEAGYPFKHHCILDEETFLYRCEHEITPVYTDRCKFHYSEIGIIFLGYFLEKNYAIKMEDLFQRYVIEKFKLHSSYFSRIRIPGVYTQDLSDEYDYPAVAILDHGYFCYSNGYYTTLNDMKLLIENLLSAPVFQLMTDLKHARAASNRLLNGMAVEIRLHGDDVIYGYEGLSFSGCNLWAYSTKKQEGYISFSNNEEKIYDDVYGRWGYTTFDKVPDYTQQAYLEFIKHYDFNIKPKEIPKDYQGDYHRVNINEKTLATVFFVRANDIVIRNPDEVQYDVVYVNDHYCVKGKDGVHGARVGLYRAASGNHYMLYDGTLYKKII